MVSETHPLLSAKERERETSTRYPSKTGGEAPTAIEREGETGRKRESTLKSLKPTSNDHHYHFDNI